MAAEAGELRKQCAAAHQATEQQELANARLEEQQNELKALAA